MQIKRYEVTGIKDALAKINADLGPDAIILSTKRIKQEGKAFIEVIAARDDKETETLTQLRREIPDEVNEKAEIMLEKSDIRILQDEVQELKLMLKNMKTQNRTDKYLFEIHEAMNAFMDVLGLKRKGKDLENSARIYYELVNHGVSNAKALQVTELLARGDKETAKRGYEENRARLEEIIREHLVSYTGGVTDKRVKAFIGPTGVGKTTTLAKLAAHYSLDKKLEVGIITADTYRIAAVEQLRIYANIMNIPLEVVTGKIEFEQALSSYDDKDIILVDTPGRSRTDETYLTKLMDIFKSDELVEKSLLLSLTTSKDNLLEIASRYDAIDYDNMIITKIDECPRCGLIYDFLEQVKRPVSYLTCGQNVPRDIVAATPARLTRLIMESRLH